MPTTPSGSTFGTSDPYSSSSYQEHMGAPIVGRLPDLPDINKWLEAVRGIFGYEGIPGLPGAVGPSIYGRGVFDTAYPGLPDVLHRTVPEWEPEVSAPEPETVYGEGWPDEWKGDGGGWNDDDWVTAEEAEEMAHDWGHLIRQGIETYTGIGTPTVAQIMPTQGGTIVGPASTLQTATLPGGSVSSNALCPPAGSCGGPRYLTYDCKTGQMSVRRRRRRRRLLTEGDKSDLGVIVAMFGKGAAAQIALAAAVKR